METINERFKQTRLEIKKSQEDFGKMMGITKSSVSNIESGLRKVTEKHIKLLCGECDVSESWLRTGNGEMFPTLKESDKFARLIGKIMRQNSLSGDKTMIETLANLIKIREIASDDQWNLVKKTIKNWAEEEKEE